MADIIAQLKMIPNCSSVGRVNLIPDFDTLSLVSGNVLSTICPRDDQETTTPAMIQPPATTEMTDMKGLLE